MPILLDPRRYTYKLLIILAEAFYILDVYVDIFHINFFSLDK